MQAVSSAPDKALKPKVSKSESLTECCRRTPPSLSDPQTLLDSAKGTNGLTCCVGGINDMVLHR